MAHQTLAYKGPWTGMAQPTNLVGRADLFFLLHQHVCAVFKNSPPIFFSLSLYVQRV